MYRAGLEPSMLELLATLEKALDRFDVAYVVIDALDESSPRSELLQVIQTLASDIRFQKLRLAVSSREYHDIKIMIENVFTAIPMDNPALMGDILRYVRSTLKTNRRFQHWPEDLLKDVEVTVSTGARGMFRWAVCQLDVIQRLRSDPRTVRRALQSLPKTLYKTYDMILLGIPEEERLFVYHILQWIALHTDLHGHGMPKNSILIEAAKKTVIRQNPRSEDIHYDIETLREFCGCLIDCTSSSSIKFAHFTVREYLDSPRLPEILYSVFPHEPQRPGTGETLRQNFIELILEEAHCLELKHALAPVQCFLTSYCAMSGCLSLRKFQDDIVQKESLAKLATSLLDPSKLHFKPLKVATSSEDRHRHIYDQGWPSFAQFFNISWKTNPPSNELEQLFYLLLTYCDQNKANGLELARRFLKGQAGIDLKLASSLDFEYLIYQGIENPRWFGDQIPRSNDRNMFEMFALWSSQGSGPLDLILEFGAELPDPTAVLICFLQSAHSGPSHYDRCCLLQRILHAGADANGYKHYPGYITPLQLAVKSGDSIVAELLLKAGARPE
ncbi:hypothetical protein K505DRAFT_339198 [Melanomma pulvis-pyrius CBS 109.77]|uniref:Nephrocystin 3-like N-terminal domain-containing protein n=1 Tax=Melanomma pulvis-pyrius CBS 109.77 TaxID=1314802 RepID=A0A6A6X6C1_9PLEO|nr:hypothetical protein K505DRAFT_339198 [Melanomma pulvis-pyrius CBS 109.77]